MRILAFALTVPPLIAALLVAVLIATAMPAPASQPAAAARERAARIEECMREMRGGLKAGQQMTQGQRRMAEELCRARVEAATQSRR